MKKPAAAAMLFVFVLFLTAFLRPYQKTYAFQAEVEAKGNASISAIVGESITLKQYAQNMQTEEYTITGGQWRIRDNQNGTYTFLSAGSVQIVSKVYNLNHEQVASYTWNFYVSTSYPVITDQPKSVSVLSGEDASFIVETRQEAEFLSYRWICSDPAGKNVSVYIFPDAEGWTSKTLTIHNAKAWMGGYKFYCIVSLASNTLAKVYTTTAWESYPTLRVRTHPIESVLTLEGLDTPAAGQKADYQVSLDTGDCRVTSVEYYVNGVLRENYVPSPGEKVEIRVAAEAASEYSFSGSEYYLLWNGFQNDSISGSTSQKVFTFEFKIPDQNPESEFSDSDYTDESNPDDDPDNPGHDIYDRTLVRTIAGYCLIAGILGLFVFLILRSRKRDDHEE